MKFKSIKEMNKKFKRTLLDEILYYGFYSWYYWFKDRLRKLYWFLQRGWRGYADCDTWAFDDYLSRIIIGGLKQLKKYSHSEKPSKKEFDIMIKGFESNIKMMNMTSVWGGKQYLKYKSDFNQGMKLFHQYFNYLWD